MNNFTSFIGKALPIVFAAILILFTVNYNWRISKVKPWVPYVFLIFLVFYVLHSFLKIIGINLIEQVLEQDVISAFIQKYFSGN